MGSDERVTCETGYIIELFEERAAIIEFESNQTRKRAEVLASLDIQKRFGSQAKAIISQWLRERQ